jgi:predicted NodU family carbamoyl transferase
MSYDVRHIVEPKPPVLELEGGGTSARRHGQASIAML